MDSAKKTGFITGALFLASVIWGFGSVTMRICIDGGIRAGMQMFLRFGIGSVCLGIMSIKKIRYFNRRLVLCSALCGSLLFFAFFILTLSASLTTPAKNAFLSSASVMVVPFLSWLMLKVRPSGSVFCGCFLCLAGVGVLSFQPGGYGFFGSGDLLSLLSAVFFALYTCTVAKFSGGLETLSFTFLQLLTTALWSAASMPFSGGWAPSSQVEPRAVWAVVCLGLFNTGLCYLIQMTAQKVLSPSRVSLIIATESLFSAILSVLAGYDSFSWRLVAGGGIMILSILMVETDIFKFKKKKHPAKN